MAAKGKGQPGWLHIAISWGASIVIIGALAKILHIGGELANWFIGAGLGIEALLFFLTGFFPPEPELPWEKVYPELGDNYSGEARKVPTSVGGGSGYPATAALDAAISTKIGPELIESLGTGLRTFGEKVATISNVTDAAVATNEFTGKVKTASSKFDDLGNAFDKATAQLVEMGDSKVDTQAYHDQVNNLAKNLSALNAVYELELQDSSAHLKSMNKFYQNLSLTMNNFNESMEDSKQFKEEVGKLAKNLSSLNAIYGNMLTAMNQPRT
jgi:gliding motility-associated protein GldL